MRERLLAYLRDALDHLHEPTYLRESPLAALFGVANRLDTARAVRTILVEAIEALKPRADHPSSPQDWEIYEILLCCYVQGISRRVVADQLAISVRHLRRQQLVALESLADALLQRTDLEAKLDPRACTEPAEARSEVSASIVLDELAWLKNTPLEKPTDFAEALSSALDLARPLAAAREIHVEPATIEALPGLAVHPLALSQLLLLLLGAAIHQVGRGGRIAVSGRPSQWEVEVEILGPSQQAGLRDASARDPANLDIAQHLADLCGCRLTVDVTTSYRFRADLILPALERLPVLVIDDNADTLQLLQRYMAGTRYCFIGLQDAEQAAALAAERLPEAIVLDVMMPHADGWKVLGRLRQHPASAHIPILVCTILPQEALARMLGASGFVQKPLTRQGFLAALDAQLLPADTGRS